MFRRRNVLIAIIISILTLLAVLAIPVLFSVARYLSKTERVEANILLIEGWLPPYAIELGYNEFKNNGYDLVVTTGIGISGYYEVSMNGYLIFNTTGKLPESDKNETHILQIDAFGESYEDTPAHFNLFINDSMVADFYADTKEKLYRVNFPGDLKDIDSVMIQFDNDKSDSYGDRNLYVKEIVFDNDIHIPYQQNSEYVLGSHDGKRRFNNNFNSHAEIAANVLLSLGIDSSRVFAVPGKEVKINRTLSSALAFRDWLKNSTIEVSGINIVTMGTHAGRTSMTYNKILDKKYKVGIISLPNYRENSSRKYRIFKTIKETVGIIYYRIILIPY